MASQRAVPTPLLPQPAHSLPSVYHSILVMALPRKWAPLRVGQLLGSWRDCLESCVGTWIHVVVRRHRRCRQADKRMPAVAQTRAAGGPNECFLRMGPKDSPLAGGYQPRGWLLAFFFFAELPLRN